MDFQGLPLLNIAIYALYVCIAICSLLSLAFALERFAYLRTVKMDVDNFMVRIRKAVEAGRVMEAIAVCEATPNPIANLIKAGLKKHKAERAIIKEAIEDAAGAEIPKLERFLTAMSTIATITPLLGLLGTVIGMIQAFSVIAVQGTGNPHALAGGISGALMTTALGLVVAIPTIMAYNYFTNKVNNFITGMELRSSEVVDIISGNAGGGETKGGKTSSWDSI